MISECVHSSSVDNRCIFTEILKKIDTGIIILDLENKEVFFKNFHAVTILKHGEYDHSFESVSSLLSKEIAELQHPGITRSSRTIKWSGHRVLGFSIYRMTDSKRFIFIFIRDITDQHRLDAIDEASEMMNNIGYLFSGIRHEIGNPLNSIKMALTVLQNNINNYSEKEFQVYFKRIFGEVSKIEILLKSFKNFNLFEKPETKEVNIADFFDDLVQLLTADLNNKDIGIIVDFPENARGVCVDPRALQHVIMNILANAIDAMEGVKNPTLFIKSRAGENSVELSIKDNGSGMSPDHLQNMFKPFFTTKLHGTGLGLALSKKMLTQMNGRIGISSEKDVGTEVTITMPTMTGMGVFDRTYRVSG
ncbi:sensor histidine kinase [Thermodesulfobacteriota bacterium]